MARVRVGLCENRVEPGDGRIRDEALRAVEDVDVAVSPCGRAHRSRIRARSRLGQRVGGENLTGGEPRQEPRHLLLGPGELEPERAELLHREDEPARRTHLRDLLDRDKREERPGAGTAVLLVEQQAEDAVLAEQLDDVPRELVRLVDLGRTRRDALARERADEFADLELLVGQRLPGHAPDCRARCMSPLLGLLAHRLDVVAVSVVYERAVVVLVVVRAQARAPLSFPPAAIAAS